MEFLLFLSSQEDLIIAKKLLKVLGEFLLGRMVACFSAPWTHQLLLRASQWLCPGSTSQAPTVHLGWSESYRYAEVGGKLGEHPHLIIPQATLTSGPHLLSERDTPGVGHNPGLELPRVKAKTHPGGRGAERHQRKGQPDW